MYAGTCKYPGTHVPASTWVFDNIRYAKVLLKRPDRAFQIDSHDILPRGRDLGDEKLQSPGFSDGKQRVSKYSVLEGTLVLEGGKYHASNNCYSCSSPGFGKRVILASPRVPTVNNGAHLYHIPGTQ